jgi:hypothetical protein
LLCFGVLVLVGVLKPTVAEAYNHSSSMGGRTPYSVSNNTGSIKSLFPNSTTRAIIHP